MSSNLLSRISKIEEKLGAKNEWRTGDKFLNTLNKNYGDIFQKEDLQFFDSKLEAFICGIELCSKCLDVDCKTCTDETCTEVKKRVKQRSVYEFI